MRLKARTDRNQSEIVLTLRKLGCSVCCLHAIATVTGIPEKKELGKEFVINKLLHQPES